MIAREHEHIEELKFIGTNAEPRVYRVASDVGLEDYLEFFADSHCEYVEGEVYREMPIDRRHELLRLFLIDLLRVYFNLTTTGEVLWEPTVMFQPVFPKRRRMPDIMVVLNDGQATIEPTQVNGAADIVIEIVSPGSYKIDHVEKFEEFEKSGVKEYWLFDFTRKNALFYRLSNDGLFQAVSAHPEGYYETPLLPRFKLNIASLWQEKLPDVLQSVQMVQAMLKE